MNKEGCVWRRTVAAACVELDELLCYHAEQRGEPYKAPNQEEFTRRVRRDVEQWTGTRYSLQVCREVVREFRAQRREQRRPGY